MRKRYNSAKVSRFTLQPFQLLHGLTTKPEELAIICSISIHVKFPGCKMEQPTLLTVGGELKLDFQATFQTRNQSTKNKTTTWSWEKSTGKEPYLHAITLDTLCFENRAPVPRWAEHAREAMVIRPCYFTKQNLSIPAPRYQWIVKINEAPNHYTWTN